MGTSDERIVAVIMVGGPTTGTQFRPLSLNVPKPLIPLAGMPMIHHPISACRRIPNLAQVYLIGFYEEREFALYVSSISNELKVPVRYLREDKPHGSAGGLYNFRDYIMDDNPSHIFLLNFDVCCSFPLPEMLEAHKNYGGMGTMLVIKVSAESAHQFGELVADPNTKELLHYTKKPETFVSDLINCGVYIFTPEIFLAIQDAFMQRKVSVNPRRITSFEALQSATKALPTDFVRLDQDILSPLARKKKFYTYETQEFWGQIKTPGGVVVQIGPNVSISANVRIGPGVRLINCIILDDIEIQDNAIVIHSIVGWKSVIGKWSRVQGEGDYYARLGITILGEAVGVEDEVVVVDCIVLPHKTLSSSVQGEIIL